MYRLTELDRRRIRNFRANKRALWSLRIFAVLFVLSLFAELIANDKPLLVSYKGGLYTPIVTSYAETTFGGEFETEADYTDPVLHCLIRTGAGLDPCLDEADGIADAPIVEAGWMLHALQQVG